MLKKITILLMTIFLTFLSAQETNKNFGKFIGAKESFTPSWFYNSFLDLNEDIEELASNNKRLILYISQNNCPYCHKFVNENLQDKEIVSKIKTNFEMINIDMFGNNEVVDINGDELSEKDYAIKHKIQFTPTLIFFDEKSNEILRLNGYVNIKQFNIALDYISNKNETKIAYKDFLSKELNLNVKTDLIENSIFSENRNFARNKNSKAMAIFFESPNCKECEVLHNKLLKNDFTLELLSKLELNRVNMNSEKSVVTPQKIISKIKDWSNDLKINHTPTIIFFDEKGNEIIRIESLIKTFHFQSIIDYVGSGAYKEEKEFQRYLTKRANAIREKGIDVNIWD